jgi:hypothetical protein
MCLKGGPRCYTHAKDAYEKTTAKWEKALAEEHGLQKKLNTLPEESKSRKRVESKLEEARKKLAVTAEKKHAALVEAKETSHGVELLAEKAAKAKQEEPGSMKAKRLARDYMEAEAGYNAKLKQYDLRNRTVDSKIPSGYASRIGIEHLENLKKKNLQAWKKAHPKDEASNQKFAEKNDSIQGQIDHAKKTLERIASGELPRLYAPPSPALQRTKAFDAYVKTANAAESMQTVKEELNRVGLSSTGQALVHPQSSAYPAYVRKQKAIAANKAKMAELPPKPSYRNVIRIEDLPYEERKLRESQIKRTALLSGQQLPEKTPEIEGQGELF